MRVEVLLKNMDAYYVHPRASNSVGLWVGLGIKFLFCFVLF